MGLSGSLRGPFGTYKEDSEGNWGLIGSILGLSEGHRGPF